MVIISCVDKVIVVLKITNLIMSFEMFNNNKKQKYFKINSLLIKNNLDSFKHMFLLVN